MPFLAFFFPKHITIHNNFNSSAVYGGLETGALKRYSVQLETTEINHITLDFTTPSQKVNSQSPGPLKNKLQTEVLALDQMLCNRGRLPEEPVKGTFSKCAVKKHIELSSYALEMEKKITFKKTTTIPSNSHRIK